MNKKAKHRAYIINLKHSDISQNGKIKREITYDPKDVVHIASDLIDAVWHISKEVRHCPNCGRLVPELGIQFKGKEYRFTCYEVADALTGRVFTRTDYKKFARYCQKEK